MNIDDVLRYFVVHNYVVNGDSYTGSMIHNYYLYEEDGQLSMIPWDYNLAFGTFQGNNASSAVNDDIDDVLSDRPMQAWIFSDEAYSQQYYELYAELLEQVDVQAIIDNAYKLIAPYVEKDPTAFCTYDEFQTGVETLKEFCTLRSESVQLQLSGSAETVDVGTLDLSDMGTMNMGGGRGGFGGRGNFGDMDFGNTGNSNNAVDPNTANTPNSDISTFPQTDNNEVTAPDDIQISEEMEMPGGMQMPSGMEPPSSIQQPGNSEAPESSAAGDNDGSENAAENTSPNNAGNFVNFSPSGEMPGFGNMGGFNGMTGNGQGSAAKTSTVVLLAVSVLFLAVGLIVAFKFKR